MVIPVPPWSPEVRGTLHTLVAELRGLEAMEDSLNREEYGRRADAVAAALAEIERLHARLAALRRP